MEAEFSPPPVIDSARVIAYTIVDDSVDYRNRGLVYVDGEPLQRVPRLAICESLQNESELLLFYCDEAWDVLAIAGGDTVPEIQRRVEQEYRGIGRNWKGTESTLEAALEYYDSLNRGLICAFCGKRPNQVECMIKGAHASICRDCAREMYNEFNEAG